MGKKDTIYNSNIPNITPFSFSSEVAEVFDDMAFRSIPGYNDIQRMLAKLAVMFYQKGTQIYDLGCSTGNTELEILKNRTQFDEHDYPIIKAIDKSQEMITIASGKCNDSKIDWICDDITSIEIKNASIVIASYVFQFIPHERRQAIVSDIYNGISNKGIFLLAEKVISPSDKVEKIINDLYINFKRENGYSEQEIIQKAEALKGVLFPCTLDNNIQMLKTAGFSSIEIIYKNLNFVCIGAVK